MLHLNDITLRLGPRLLFDKATAALPGHARVGFVGRNGTGKTTLFRMILRRARAGIGVDLAAARDRVSAVSSRRRRAGRKA